LNNLSNSAGEIVRTADGAGVVTPIPSHIAARNATLPAFAVAQSDLQFARRYDCPGRIDLAVRGFYKSNEMDDVTFVSFWIKVGHEAWEMGGKVPTIVAGVSWATTAALWYRARVLKGKRQKLKTALQNAEESQLAKSAKRISLATAFTLTMAMVLWYPYKITKDESDGRIAALIEGRRASIREQRQKDRAEKLSDKLLISPDRATPLKVDLADNEARAQLQSTEAKLMQAEERIRALDPMTQPIASITATVDLLLTVQDPKGSTNIEGSPAWIAFGKDKSPVALGYTSRTSYVKEGPTTVRFRFTVNIQPDADIMGKGMAALTDSEYLQIMLPTDWIPLDTPVTSGRVTWVVNNVITLKFTVPAQRTVRVEGETNGGVFVRSLSEGLSNLNSHAAKR
jgi:hypothetical protein